MPIFIGKQRLSARIRANRGRPASASAATASRHASRCDGLAWADGSTKPPSVRIARGFFMPIFVQSLARGARARLGRQHSAPYPSAALMFIGAPDFFRGSISHYELTNSASHLRRTNWHDRGIAAPSLMRRPVAAACAQADIAARLGFLVLEPSRRRLPRALWNRRTAPGESMSARRPRVCAGTRSNLAALPSALTAQAQPRVPVPSVPTALTGAALLVIVGRPSSCAADVDGRAALRIDRRQTNDPKDEFTVR